MSNDVPTQSRRLVIDGVRSFWEDKVKPWGDFRAYLRQRRTILSHPNLDFPSEVTSDKDWKSPLVFALQGTLFVAIILKLMTSSMSIIHKPPELSVMAVASSLSTSSDQQSVEIPDGTRIYAAKATLARRDLASLKQKIDEIRSSPDSATFSDPIPYNARDNRALFILGAVLAADKHLNKQQALSAYRSEYTTLTRQAEGYELSDRTQIVSDRARGIFAPLAIILSASIFAMMSRLTRSKRDSYPARGRETEFYLYYLTAAIFWPVLVINVIIAAQSIYHAYMPPTMLDAAADLGNALGEIDKRPRELSSRDLVEWAFGIAKLATYLWAYLSIRQAASALVEPFGMKTVSGFFPQYDGQKKIRKDIIISNIIVSILIAVILVLAAICYPTAVSVLRYLQLG